MQTPMYSRAAQAGQNAAAKHQVGQRLGQQNTFQNRGFEDNEDLFRRVLEEERQYSLKKPSAIYSQAGSVTCHLSILHTHCILL